MHREGREKRESRILGCREIDRERGIEGISVSSSSLHWKQSNTSFPPQICAQLTHQPPPYYHNASHHLQPPPMYSYPFAVTSMGPMPPSSAPHTLPLAINGVRSIPVPMPTAIPIPLQIHVPVPVPVPGVDDRTYTLLPTQPHSDQERGMQTFKNLYSTTAPPHTFTHYSK